MSTYRVFFIWAVCLSFVSISVYADESPLPPQVLVWQKAAQDSIAQDAPAAAVAYYQKIQDSFPGTSYAVDAQCRIVNLYLQSGQPDKTAEALALLKEKYSSVPDYVRLVHELGWEFVKKQDYVTALQIYKDLQADFPHHPRAVWFQRSMVQTYLEQGDIEKVKQAVEDLKNNYQTHSDYANQMKITADRLRGKRQFALAEEIYSHLLLQMPDHKDFIIWKRMQIQNALDMGQREWAKAQAENLFLMYQDRPEFVQQVHELGWEFVQKRDYATALRIYTGLQKQFSDHERAVWFQRSMVQAYLEQGDTAKALEAVEQMKTDFQTCPDYVNQMEKLPADVTDKNQPAAAKGVCEVLLEKYPNHPRQPWFLQAKARSEVWIKDPNSADSTVARMQQECINHPDYADAMSWTAYEYRKAGYYRRAIELYEALLAQNPPPKVRLRSIAGIAQAYVRLGEDDKVQEKVDYLLSNFKDNSEGEAFYTMGIGEEYCLVAEEISNEEIKQQAYKQSIGVWQKYILSGIRSSLDARIYYFTAFALSQLENYKEAIVYGQQAVEKWPSFDRAWQCLLLTSTCYEKLIINGKISQEEADESIRKCYIQILEKHLECAPLMREHMINWLNEHKD